METSSLDVFQPSDWVFSKTLTQFFCGWRH